MRKKDHEGLAASRMTHHRCRARSSHCRWGIMTTQKKDRMVAFAARATVDATGGGPSDLDPQTAGIVEWLASTKPEEVMAFRERATQAVERLGEQMRQQGETADWLESADKALRQVVELVNGPLMMDVVKATRYADSGVVDMMHEGAPLVGRIPASPNCVVGNGCRRAEAREPALLRGECKERNVEFLATLKSDKHAGFLMEQAKEDAQKGRMTEAVPLRELDLENILLGRRFSREQGVRADGSLKLRAIDDKTADGTNDCAQQEGKLRMDGLDKLVEAVRLFTRTTGKTPHLWKADVDSAFRRVPVQPGDYWAAWVAFLDERGEIVAARHNALMFGSVASVHGWDRLGAFLEHVVKVLLRIPAMRYVDDFSLWNTRRQLRMR